MGYLASLLLVLFLLSGCATTPVANEAIGEDAISTLTMSCKEPYKLSQDCSSWSGAARKLTIDGFNVKVAGTEKGDVVLVMDANPFGNAMKEAFTLNLAKNYHSESSNNSLEAIKKVLLNGGIQIFRVRPLFSMNGIDGYVLEISGDGYTLLKKYTSQ